MLIRFLFPEPATRFDLFQPEYGINYVRRLSERGLQRRAREKEEKEKSWKGTRTTPRRILGEDGGERAPVKEIKLAQRVGILKREGQIQVETRDKD